MWAQRPLTGRLHRHSPAWARSPRRGCTRIGRMIRRLPQERPRQVTRTSPGNGKERVILGRALRQGSPEGIQVGKDLRLGKRDAAGRVSALALRSLHAVVFLQLPEDLHPITTGCGHCMWSKSKVKFPAEVDSPSALLPDLVLKKAL